MTRVSKKFGWYYRYEPRYILVDRLSKELNLSHEEVRQQIRKERNFIIENILYYK